MSAASRLWDKGQPLDELVHRFTVGDDPHWDLRLVHSDCVASAAHARTLHRAGLLDLTDLDALVRELRQIVVLADAGQFPIPRELEDCHTAIETHLTKAVGEPGRRIHTGRSRNDQVATAMRLYLRRQVVNWVLRIGDFASAALERIEADGATPLPGYTHMQPAMPSSVGQWLHASVEAALDQMRAGLQLLERIDCCPLGSGAGFGVPLPLDRAFTAQILGFSGVQRNPIDVQNSRGRFELYAVRLAADCAALLEKFAWDLLLFTSAEYGFFALPDGLTTGSSIMPQKRNPDVLELMRARAARLRGRQTELEWIIGKLPSSYHRDLQLTKEPVFRAADDVMDLLAVGERVVQLLRVVPEKIAAAMRPELFATQAAYRLVRAGTPFRDAYRAIGKQVTDGTFVPPASDATEIRPEIVDAAMLATLRGEVRAHADAAGAWLARFDVCERTVLE